MTRHGKLTRRAFVVTSAATTATLSASFRLLPSARAAGAEQVTISVEGTGQAGSVPAAVSSVAVGKHRLRIDVDPGQARESLVLRVELPASGSGYWPAEDIEVLDGDRQAVLRNHNGTEWHKFTMRVPPRRASYLLHAVPPEGTPLRVFPENRRAVTDVATGLRANIAKWYDGRPAALCMRFDDSHPSHVLTVIPVLRRHGFRATFMINPGVRDERCSPRWRSAYQEHRADWEAVAQQGDQEFANHTLHHRGATDDRDMDREIGEAARIIWSLFPNRSRLLALNLGGGTWWKTTKTLRRYLEKYPSFIVTGSLGMDDTYGNRLAAFRRHLERNLESGLGWCKVHFHSVGKGAASSEENFRAALDAVKQHESKLWITGLADAYQYLAERRGTALEVAGSEPRRVVLRLTCSTDAQLFQQPLTVDVTLPKSWDHRRVTVADSNGKPALFRQAGGLQNPLVRFDVPPVSAEYTLVCGGIR